MLAAIIVAAYLAVGVLVAARSVPWADVSFHAPFARRHGEPPSSPTADRVFFACCVLLWPVAWRFRHVGAFAGELERDGGAAPFERVDEGVPSDRITDADANFLARVYGVTPDDVREHLRTTPGVPVDDVAASTAAAHKLLGERDRAARS